MKSEAFRKNAHPPDATTTEADRKEGNGIVYPESDKTFPCSKAGMQPCMSFMSFTRDPVLRGQEENPARQATCKGYVPSPVIDAEGYQRIGGHRISYSDSDRRFWHTVCVNARKEALAYLILLIKNDDGIGVADAQVLCNAVNIIGRAGLS